MSRWLENFLRKEGRKTTDNTDKTVGNGDLSVLSVSSPDTFAENLENIPRNGTDNTDKSNIISTLGWPSSYLFSSSGSSIKSDTLIHDYEERLAIAEIDGHQTHLRAQRIAYLDAFVSVLVTLPQESFLESSQRDWLDRRIMEAKSWLSAQGLEQPK